MRLKIGAMFMLLTVSAIAEDVSLPMLQPGDPQYLQQQPSLNTVNLENAWDTTTGSHNVIVAVIDDAIDTSHPDLRSNMMQGRDFVSGDNDPSPDLLDACNAYATHGTAMAGIIGAVGQNNIGVTGVNWLLNIMPLRVGCHYNSLYEYQAIKYAVEHGAHIINASYGGPLSSSYTLEIIKLLEDNDVLLVTAAGNYHGNNDYAPMYPGNLDSPNIITVAASDSQKHLTPWSQYGAASVDVAAPGVELLTTRFESSMDPLLGSYARVSGTSASTAVVSGVAALLKARDLMDGQSDLSALDIKAAILSSSSPLSGTSGKLQVDGVVDAAAAMEKLNALAPEIVVHSVVWNDAVLGNGNGAIDPGESASIELTLENIGPLASVIDASLVSGNSLLSIESPSGQLHSLAQGMKAGLNFQISAGSFNGHHRFPLSLSIQVSGELHQASHVRHFELESGYLINGQTVSMNLLSNEFDDYRYFHINLPPQTDNIAFELVYEPTSSRDVGLAVNYKSRPRMYFGDYLGGEYKVENGSVLDGASGIERIALSLVPGSLPSTYHAIAFSTPDLTRPNLSIQPQNVKIRACYRTTDDTNSLPHVDAGSSLFVKPGQRVQLRGEVSDEDGDIAYFWWSQDSSGPALSHTRSLTPEVVIPSTGRFVYRLHASDDKCGYSSDTVTLSVQDENDLILGMRILPGNYSVPVGGYVQTNVDALIGGIRVSNINMVSFPEGASFDKRENMFIWSNAGPAGSYSVLFSAVNPSSGMTEYGRLSINVGEKTSDEGAFGCSLGKKGNFDPVFPLILLSALVYWLRKVRFTA